MNLQEAQLTQAQLRAIFAKSKKLRGEIKGGAQLSAKDIGGKAASVLLGPKKEPPSSIDELKKRLTSPAGKALMGSLATAAGAYAAQRGYKEIKHARMKRIGKTVAKGAAIGGLLAAGIFSKRGKAIIKPGLKMLSAKMSPKAAAALGKSVRAVPRFGIKKAAALGVGAGAIAGAGKETMKQHGIKSKFAKFTKAPSITTGKKLYKAGRGLF